MRKLKKVFLLLVGCGVAMMNGMAVAESVPGEQVEEGFVSLFNGQDLTGWSGKPGFWSVQNGVIQGQTIPTNPLSENTFLVWTNGVTSDFVLRLEYRITGNNSEKWANSGVQYRSKRVNADPWRLAGYQADIDANLTYTGILYEELGRGILSLRGESTVIEKDTIKKTVLPHEEQSLECVSASLRQSIHPGDWNSYSIRVETVANGAARMTHTINGQLMSCVVDASGKGATSGLLGLQLHAGESMTIEFKNIRMKSLK